MLNAIKNFINSENAIFSTPDSKPVEENNVVENKDVQILNQFEENCEKFTEHENFPKKAKEYFDKIIKIVKAINVDVLSLEDQVKIRRHLEVIIPETVNNYLALPKAHAVSIIIERNKTSKELFIEKLSEYERLIDLISIKAVEEQTSQMVKKQKASSIVPEAKRDFFDM